ncbi:MAG: DNA-binding response regulator, partial [Rhodospirillaceae bacterium]|nr:DNA-binding response regulator [Rhodospirillaceae bacterium]
MMSKSEHILVVDDEPGICKLLDRYLSQQGYRVSTA